MLDSKMKIEYTNAEFDPPQVTKVEDQLWDENDSQLDAIKDFFGRFLHFVGFPSYNKDYIFMESVTDDEYEYLADFLSSLRDCPKGQTVYFETLTGDELTQVVNLLSRLRKEKNVEK